MKKIIKHYPMTDRLIVIREYLLVDPIFQGLCFLSGFPLYRVTANNKGTEVITFRSQL
jgi:hypothetical protein